MRSYYDGLFYKDLQSIHPHRMPPEVPRKYFQSFPSCTFVSFVVMVFLTLLYDRGKTLSLGFSTEAAPANARASRP
jgi:hypothetical protein